MAIANRIADIPVVKRNVPLRSFFLAAWLGWQIESNWASPFLFAIYSIARPVASVLILVVMYSVITDGATKEPIFAYIYMGNALYILVSNIVTGISWAVIDDREHYRTAKQIHTAPISGYAYLLGRGVARLFIGSISVLITIIFGIIAFNIPLSIDLPLLIAGTIVGVASLAAFGVILGALTLQLGRNAWTIGDAVGGGLYLFTGAIFPLDVLPAWLQPIGYLLPATYWLEVTRRALLGANVPRFPTFAGFSDWGLIGILAIFSALMWAFSIYFYNVSLRRARNQGLLDMETNY